jgi:hypothetical protein
MDDKTIESLRELTAEVLRQEGVVRFSNISTEAENALLYACKEAFRPRYILINNYRVPEPERVAPEIGDKFFYPIKHNENLVSYNVWDGSEQHMCLLRCGQIHLTEKAAIAHSEAELSATRLKEG